jgi:hypothetical protein
MTTKTTLKWRLSKLPTVEELRDLVKDGVITKDEARDVLFNRQDEEDRDKESLQAEIKFLRELISNLSSRSTIVEFIRDTVPKWSSYGWTKPYITWCGSTADSGCQTTTTYAYSSAGDLPLVEVKEGELLSDIKTF